MSTPVLRCHKFSVVTGFTQHSISLTITASNVLRLIMPMFPRPESGLLCRCLCQLFALPSSLKLTERPVTPPQLRRMNLARRDLLLTSDITLK